MDDKFLPASRKFADYKHIVFVDFFFVLKNYMSYRKSLM